MKAINSIVKKIQKLNNSLKNTETLMHEAKNVEAYDTLKKQYALTVFDLQTATNELQNLLKVELDVCRDLEYYTAKDVIEHFDSKIK